MFILAILLGIYAYGFFFLGILHSLFSWSITGWTVCCFVIGTYLLRKETKTIRLKMPKDIISLLAISCLLVLAGVNLIGVLGPETSFDALWYHLTFPKLYIQQHSITYIPGGLLYYSLMPKLGEMLFIPSLFFGNEITAKAVQYIFGILTTIVVYKISRKYFSISLSLVASLVFYSNIVVSWESTIAYIDLIRAFYESMALWALLLWMENQKKLWFVLSAILLGLAITTKVLALGSLSIFVVLIVFALWHKKTWKSIGVHVVFFSLIVLLLPSPWFLFSYVHTGNPVYPFFTSVYPVHAAIGTSFFQDIGRIFLFGDDPISPVYLIVLPLLVMYFSKLPVPIKLIGYYVIASFVLWYITPRTGGGRFIVPHLPAWSLLAVGVLEQIKKQKILYITVLISIFFIALTTIGYRGIANSKYIPVVLGKESKDAFLIRNLNFSFGDFYDTDGYFKTRIKQSDTVLLYGFHNLYYIDFPFIDSSWVKKGDTFNYIATQHMSLPSQYTNWQLVYENQKTFVRLYKYKKGVWKY